jgi:hypothetical protein
MQWGVVDCRDKLISVGLKRSELSFPRYAECGEFGIGDPDGCCLPVGDTEQRQGKWIRGKGRQSVS